MGKAGSDPPSIGDTAFDRFLRFGTALFAVKKDELPKRRDRAKPKREPGTKKASS